MIVPRGEKSTARAQLYTDDSSDSQKTRVLLIKNGITFDEWQAGVHFRATDGFKPILNTAEGHYTGLEKIQRWVHYIIQMRQQKDES